MLLFNVMGIACVKYNRFRELDNILRLSVPAPNFIDIARRRPLLYLLGGTHWSYDRWNSLMRERYYYPFSIFFLEELRPFFKDYFIVDSEYENTFFIWEHMKSLIYGYNKCYILSESFPLGEFLRREYMYKEYGNDEPYTIFWESADNLKNEWAPIKQGMFGGRYENYKTISEKANAYYKQNRKF